MIHGTLRHNPKKHIPVACRVYRSTAKTIATATNTLVDFDSEAFDPFLLHNPASNPERITIPTGYDGLWEFKGQIGFVSNATGVRQAMLSKNAGGGSPVGQSAYLLGAAPGGNSSRYQTFSGEVEMVAGDWMAMYVYQDSGGNLNTESGYQLLWMSARFLGKV